MKFQNPNDYFPLNILICKQIKPRFCAIVWKILALQNYMPSFYSDNIATKCPKCILYLLEPSVLYWALNALAHLFECQDN